MSFPLLRILVLAIATTSAQAQVVAPAPAASSARQLDRVEITGGRATDTEERRRSTAAKIIVGRDELDRHGDSTIGEVLKRLPGVTVPGAPGRGGGVRMRGLGSGYTQILLDGQRVPPGFSLDTLAPEQVERIEVLRAPTAETGARAIAGTINIVTREGFRRRLNDLKLGFAVEDGRVSPGASWSRNLALGDWTANMSLSAFDQRRGNESETHTVERAPDGGVAFEQREAAAGDERRRGLHLNSRWQWRGEGGRSLVLTPFLVHSQGGSSRDARLRQSVPDPAVVPPTYATSTTDGDSDFTMLRLNGQWNHRVGEGRLEWRGGLGRASSTTRSLRREFDDGAAAATRTVDDDARVDDDSASVSLKWLRQLANEHGLVAGAELEGTRRDETHVSLGTTAAGTRRLLADLGDNFRASTTRVALYAQDEWNVTPHWSAHAGLRWEGITTRADGLENRSSVATPIAHAVWKPDPKGRDQLRLSLTRSYKSPTLSQLIARPVVSGRYPLDAPPQPDGAGNRETAPDRVGNPALKPELATGLDIAVERYLDGGGMLSANLFHRRVRDLIRTLTSLQQPAWSSTPRWVSQPQNIGRAITQGLELEAKFRSTDVWADTPPVDLRANLSLFRSRVASVPGPDNRLDQQPRATANLGADHRLRGWPLAVGGNVNWNPSFTTRLSETQWAVQGAKRIVDAYVLWTVQPGLQLRVSGSNLRADEYLTASTVGAETSATRTRSYRNVQVRAEMKL